MRATRCSLLLPLLALAAACGGATNDVVPPAQVPVASAGPDQAVTSGAVVTLDGSGSSDPAGRPLSYAWTQASGPAVVLSSATARQPTFTAPTVAAGSSPATLTFSLVVTSPGGPSAPDAVAVTVAPQAANPVPVASAGSDQAVASGAVVTLDGSGSTDPLGRTLSYAWAQASGPAVTLSSATAQQPSFTAPTVAAGSPPAPLTFSLVVTSPGGPSAPAVVAVTVAPAPPANPPPVANAGPGQAVASGAAVTLDGSASVDADGQAITFAWTQSGGSAVALAGAGTAHPTFTAPTVAAGAAPATLGFTLVVTDANASSAPAHVTITVNPSGVTYPTPPGTPAPAAPDPNPPTTGGSGSNRWQIGAATGLYLVDPAVIATQAGPQQEAVVLGLLNVTFGPTLGPAPAGSTVTLNGVPLTRLPPPANGLYWQLDPPPAPQPQVGSGGLLVVVATGTDPSSGKVMQRTLVLPCPADVPVSSTPAVGAALAPGGSLHVAVGGNIFPNFGLPIASILPPAAATLYGYDPAARALVPAGSPVQVSQPTSDVDLTVPSTTAAAYLLDLRWQGPWIPDGESGAFCGLVKRWTYSK